MTSSEGPNPAAARLGRWLDRALVPSVLLRGLAAVLVAQLGIALALGAGGILLAGTGTVELDGMERWLYRPGGLRHLAFDWPRLLVGLCLALAAAVASVSLWRPHPDRRLDLLRLLVIAGPPLLALIPPLLSALPWFMAAPWLVLAAWLAVLWWGVPWLRKIP